MKKIIAMTLILAMVLTSLLVGCSTNQTAGEKKVVRTNIAAEPDNLNPWKSAAADTEALFRNVFEGLLSFNEKGEFTSGLAEKWDISEDTKEQM